MDVGSCVKGPGYLCDVMLGASPSWFFIKLFFRWDYIEGLDIFGTSSSNVVGSSEPSFAGNKYMEKRDHSTASRDMNREFTVKKMY